MKRVYLFKRYERLWHWLQAVLVIGLILTGFTIHGTISVLGFDVAVDWHEWLGISLVILTLFTMFWHATTGEARQFIPTKYGLFDQIRYYTSGIFRRKAHPSVPTPESKFNPVQKAAYFSLLIFVFPVQIGTGLLLWAIPHWPVVGTFIGGVKPLALIHTAGAFAMVIFIIVHVYMITTGRTILSNLRAMITGWADEQDSGESS